MFIQSSIDPKKINCDAIQYVTQPKSLSLNGRFLCPIFFPMNISACVYCDIGLSDANSDLWSAKCYKVRVYNECHEDISR